MLALPPAAQSDLFPLDGADGLGRQVHKDAVDTLNLCGDAGCDLMQHGIRNFLDCGAHSVGSIDCTDNSRPALVALLVTDAYGFQVGNGDKILPMSKPLPLTLSLTAISSR